MAPRPVLSASQVAPAHRRTHLADESPGPQSLLPVIRPVAPGAPPSLVRRASGRHLVSRSSHASALEHIPTAREFLSAQQVNVLLLMQRSRNVTEQMIIQVAGSPTVAKRSLRGLLDEGLIVMVRSVNAVSSIPAPRSDPRECKYRGLGISRPRRPDHASSTLSEPRQNRTMSSPESTYATTPYATPFEASSRPGRHTGPPVESSAHHVRTTYRLELTHYGRWALADFDM